MKKFLLQCKNIPTEPILRFLEKLDGEWANHYFRDDKDVHNAMPPAVSDKLVLAKMRVLIRKGYVDGCDCGCRGDFVITEKGKEYLKKLVNTKYNLAKEEEG